MPYQRIVLKLSGEALAPEAKGGISPVRLGHYIAELRQVVQYGVEVAVVIGGGNIWRGSQAPLLEIDNIAGHQMGMLATMMNAVALQHRLEKEGIAARLMNRLAIGGIGEPYTIARARYHLARKRLLVIGGGSGQVGFTTDTAASLAAMELQAELLVKGTHVDGVYANDPKSDPTAHMYSSLSLRQAIDQDLGVMDRSALLLCKENRLPVLVYNATLPDQLLRLLQGGKGGTFLTP